MAARVLNGRRIIKDLPGYQDMHLAAEDRLVRARPVDLFTYMLKQ